VVVGLRQELAERLGLVLPVCYNLGVLGLVCGFLRWPLLLAPSGLLLALTIAAYSVSALAGMHFDGRQTWLRSGLALALSGLLGTAVLGLVLAAGLVGLIAVPMTAIADAHAIIGLVGGTVLLTGSVGSVLLPMFQGTAVVPDRWFAAWMLGLAGVVVVAVVLRLGGTTEGWMLLAALPVSAFAVTVLVLQARAPHRRNRALVAFWRLGACALLGSTSLLLAATRWPDSRFLMVAGVLGIAVALPALVMGMLLEIVAFLAWLDLQGSRVRGHRLPSVDVLLTETSKLALFRWHALAAIALAIAAAWPGTAMVRLAALVLAMAYGFVCKELLSLWRRARRVAVAAPSPGLPLVGRTPGEP
jgi:hypothetical protein